MRILLCLLFSCFCASTSFSQDRNARAILDLLDTQTAAWNKGDLQGFMKGYWENDSLRFIGKSGITYGWSNTLANYKRGYPDTATMGKLNFTILVVKKLSPRYYEVVGKWYLKRSIGDASGHYTLLLRKIKGSWVIISDHSS
jgi:ketosteroid isomerase-like protein